MPTVLQFRRGTTSQNNAFTGAIGEITYDTTVDVLRVHDGSTAGGFAMISAASTTTFTNKTLTSPNITTSIVPTSADGATIGSASKEFSDLFLADAGTIKLGNDQDIVMTHVADTGLNMKQASTNNTGMTLTLETADTDIASGNILGALDFRAPDEGTGTDALLTAAGIAAVSEGDFSSSNNATKLSFKTAASEAAAEKMALSSTGVLTLNGGSGAIVIPNDGNIGSAGDTDAIAISSGGVVTFSQNVTVTGDLTISGDDLTMGTNTSGHVMVADGTNFNPVAISGDVSIAANGAVTIANTAVETAMIAADAITEAKIADDAVGSDQLKTISTLLIKNSSGSTLKTVHGAGA